MEQTVNVNQTIDNNSTNKIRVIELFGGIGAFTAAMKRLGIPHDVVDYVEIDKYAVKSYNAINGTNFEPQDICQWDKDIYADIIMHGSPCQDFSIAGHNKGGDEGSGTRSSLMYETIRIVAKLKPKVVVWENVKNLLSKKHRHNFDAYLDKMSEMGYTNYYQVLNAKDYGVPQNRERIFTVSFLDGREFEFPKKQELKIRLKDILEAEVDPNFYLSEKMLEKITWNTKGAEIIEVANLHKGGERGPVLDSKGICSCLSATEYKQPKQIVDDRCVGKAVRKDYESGRIKESRHNMTALAPRTDGISNTLTTVQKDNLLYEPFIAASRGRNPENPSDRTVGAPTVQMLEPNTGGVSNTLTSVQKDNYVVEPVNEYEEGIARTLKAQCYKTSQANFGYTSTYEATGVNTGFKIRKLTPKECWRLMGFPDEAFEKAAEVNSNSQLYKQAGNSIVVNVLEQIIGNLGERYEEFRAV